MIKRLITWLYNKYCKTSVSTLYVHGIQRDFSGQLSKKDEQERNLACALFMQSGACTFIFDEILKAYVEALFSIGETEKVRDALYNNINVVLKVEDLIKVYAESVEKKQEFDKFAII